MGIVRNDPVMNLDTRQPLNMLPPTQRVTRSTLHRLLRMHRIQHSPGVSKEEAINLLYTNQIPFSPPPPGRVVDMSGKPVDEVKKPLEFSADGFPKHIGKLKKLCKDNGLKFPRNASRDDLVQMLNQHLDKIG